MAPEVALEALASLQPGSRVLDPMCGSGLVVRKACEAGHDAIGLDIDPLAVLMSSVWTTPLSSDRLRERGKEIALQCCDLNGSEVSLPWLDEDHETKEFIDFWYADLQKEQLRRLASLLVRTRGPIGNALRLAMSKSIITKDGGASLARDTSHSRPHKVRESNDYDVIKGFLRSVGYLATSLENDPPNGRATVRLGDARRLRALSIGQVDAVITSPPYVNGIDYLRGHKLALVWLGDRLAELREVRGRGIGTERALSESKVSDSIASIACELGDIHELGPRMRHTMLRYSHDMNQVLLQTYSIIRPGGLAIFVVGNSNIRGVFVNNAKMISSCARRVGFREVSRYERELPANRRYLPPPRASGKESLDRRIRFESVISFRKG